MGKKITEEQDKTIRLLYVDRELTISDISRTMKLSTFAVRNSLIRQDIRIKGRQETIKRLFDKGILKPPMEGKKHKKESKLKIANSIHTTWENKTTEEKEQYGKIRSDVFAKIPDEIKKEMRTNAAKSLRKASEEGSKLERYLLNGLRKAQYKVVFHGKFLKNSKLEVDIFLPDDGILIEVQGPTHFRAVYEDGQHEKVLRADSEKAGLAIVNKMIMIYINNDFRSLSDVVCREILAKLISKLEEIKSNYSSFEGTIVYL